MSPCLSVNGVALLPSPTYQQATFPSYQIPPSVVMDDVQAARAALELPFSSSVSPRFPTPSASVRSGKAAEEHQRHALPTMVCPASPHAGLLHQGRRAPSPLQRPRGRHYHSFARDGGCDFCDELKNILCVVELLLDLLLLRRLASNSPHRPDPVQVYTMGSSWKIWSRVFRVVRCPGLLLQAARV